MKWIWHMCAANLKRRGIRTWLTILGVIIGVISIVSLLSIGMGVKDFILNEAQSFGSSKEIQVYGQQIKKRRELLLTDRKIAELKALEHVDRVYEEITLSVSLKYGNYEGYVDLVGVPREYMEQLRLINGELPSPTALRPELVVGKNALDYMYNSNTGRLLVEDYQTQNEINGAAKTTTPDFTRYDLMLALGQDANMRYNKINIAAVSEDGSYAIYCDLDVLKRYMKQNRDGMTIPGQPVDSNGKPYSEWIYSTAVVVCDSENNVDKLASEIQDIGFQAESNKETTDLIKKVTGTIQLLLGGIGMIALIVAVIGIGNTMTTSVYDRIGDIGVLKVLGCDPEELISLFLLEAGILGGIGGAIGAGLSVIITELGINKFAVVKLGLAANTRLAVIPWWLVAGALVFSIFLGILAGFFPALWASRMKPIRAMRTNA